MGTDGLGRKLVIAAAAAVAILLVRRLVGGRNGTDADEGGIDRVDTGRTTETDDGGPVSTGLERVSTDDADDGGDGSTDEEGTTGATGATGVTGATGTARGAGTDGGTGDEVPVEPTGGRFADLDLIDCVEIASAAYEAALEEYRSRT